MKKIMALVCALCAFTMTAATLPDWAGGTFKGTVENWCYDDPYDFWRGTADLTVAVDGKVSGSVAFEDGASGKTSGKGRIVSLSDREVRMEVRFNWYNEKGRSDGSSTSLLVISRFSSGVWMDFSDMDDECPVSGTLEKTSAAAVIPAEWRKARTLYGLFGDGCGGGIYGAEGTAILKCGKANKKGIAKVSLTITPFNGKKRTYKSVSVDVSRGNVKVSWPKQEYRVTIEGDSFFGEPIYGDMRPCCSPNAVWSADVGGLWTGTAKFHFGDIFDLSFGDDCLIEYAFDENFTTDLFLYTPVPVTMSGKKWTTPKAARVKWKKCPRNALCIGDWLFNIKSGSGNLSGLKLSYNSKTGLFKGSFRMFTFRGKKYTAKINGIVVDGIGIGQAVCPKLSPDSWTVTIK